MRRFQVEVVVRPIKVCRHYGNEICPVLQVVALTHLYAGNLCDGIRFIRVFEGRGEKAGLFHRLRRLTGIDTCASQKKQFLRSLQAGGMKLEAVYNAFSHEPPGESSERIYIIAREQGKQVK